MSDAPIRSFEEFWPFYLGEHSHPVNRNLHFIGTTIGMAVVAAAIVSATPWAIPLGFVTGYAFSWFGHFFIEKNRPASFRHPLWSFAADMKLWATIATGNAGKLRDRPSQPR